MKIEFKQINELIPYLNNPRKNDKSVEKVAKSIKEFGFKVPIVIDKNNTIITGHTRLKASLLLNLNNVPCIVADDLTEEQIKAFRIADNAVGEDSEWDFDLLKKELEQINIFTGFESLNNLEEIDDVNSYSQKIKIPTYEVTEEKPNLNDLYDDTKYQELMNKINGMQIDNDIKKFLILASTRFITFNYNKIAEFYAHSNKDIQNILEDLVLIIIDFNKAIEKGFIDFTDRFFNEVAEDE